MMKKTTLMLIALTCLLACRRERPVEPAAEPGRFTLEQARAWYAAQEKSSVVLDGGGGTKLFSLAQANADFSSAQSLETRSGNYWLVPLPGDMRYRNYRQGYRKLAIKRDSAGRIYARILEIIPDGLYFQRKGRASTPDFTGRIFVYDQHYHLLGGRLFSAGKVTGGIKTAANPPPGNGLRLDNVKQVTTCTWYNDNYVNAEGEVTIYSERICSTTTIDDGSTGGGFDGGSGDYLGSPPAGGGGGTSASPPAGSNLPGESGAPIRPRSYMDCFSNIPDAGASMKITVFVQEPFPGTSFNIGPNSVGHVAIGLTKSNGSQSVTQVVGYYPNASGIYKYHCPSKVVNNSNLEFDVSISYNVSANAFQQITNYISSPPTIYDLMDFNCTNFVYSACKAGGITLPDPMNTVGLGGPGGVSTAMAPAGLGASIEKLKGQSNVNTNGGLTPYSKGPCD